ncbi:family 78 glycoside hydrolase catalytic domain [Galbitalea sp. SE-J8]|uniref:alpha-L-rhamnosidase n=1 Tax=Galbitalea sp. SE-J8 TaxID=3054952 RepID=UPI00259D1A73|nr:alpha-L-rhamnosidase [Galbitalea sp. SE-J8]MDM4762043.1 family 78 glycoside hydrolase catalytic domain [Galbitalea sp. SE-J8]
MTVTITDVRVEREPRPTVIDDAPRISWTLTGPRGVAVEEARVLVRRGEDVVWTALASGSARYGAGIDCPGTVLVSDALYVVDVEVVTDAGSARASGAFRTGLLKDDAWAGARWITAPPEARAQGAPRFRIEFDGGENAAPARLFLAAGGIAHAELNGVPLGDEVLGPGFTAYDRRVQYLSWDLAPALRPGPNALTIELGRGFYGQAEPTVWEWERSPWADEPCVRFVIRSGEGEGEGDAGAGSAVARVLARSDAAVRCAVGPTVYDDVFGGESWDGRRELPRPAHPGIDDSAWSAALECDGPAGRLVGRRQPPVRALGELEGRVLGGDGDVVILDFGRVIAGTARVRVRGPEGATIALHYGERIDDAGRVDVADAHGYYNGRFQVDRLTLSGGDDDWQARFGWKGFRYVEVIGWPEGVPLTTGSVVAVVEHADLERTGAFTTSDALLSTIHELTVRTALNNLGSIPTDTPSLEKNGWTADGMLGTELFLLNVDAHELLAKWVDDIADSRDADGVPHVIAPHGGWSWDWSPAPTWHSAYVFVPWWLYRYTGDERVLRTHADGILAYLDAEYARSPGGIATTTLGDWVSPETPADGGNPPEDLRVSATAYLHGMLATAAAAMRVLGRATDADALDDRARTVAAAFRREFYDSRAAVVRGVGDNGYRQAHNVLAIAHGLIPEEDRAAVADGIARDVRARDTHLNTGALATKYLLPVLTEHGHADLALELAQQTSYPSWGHWIAQGATSLWEHWRADARSQNHYFLGTVDEWLFASVAGLAIDDVADGVIRMRPRFIGALSSARARARTPFGPTAIAWEVLGDECTLVAEVPPGARALLDLPVASASLVTESGGPLGAGAGVGVIRPDRGALGLELGGGRFEFRFPVDRAERATMDAIGGEAVWLE